MASEAIQNLLNNPDLLSDPSVLLVAGAVSLSAIALTCYCLPGKKAAPIIKEEEPVKPKGKEKQEPKKAEKNSKAKPEKKDISVNHPLWIASSSSGEITGFAYNGHKLCAVTSEDRTIRLFEPQNPDKTVMKIKDNASFIAMNDSHMVTFVSFSDSFLLYKLNPAQSSIKVKPELSLEFPKDAADKHKKDIISLEIAKNSKFVVTSSEDTIVKVWNAATGGLLGTFNTNQMVNKMVRISPDSRYITVAAFTSDVRLWEVVYKKTGEFDSIAKVMDLRGHKTGVNCVSFSGDSTRVFTAGKDGVWRMFRINVRYNIGEDPALEKSAETGSPITKMEASPDAKALAIVDKRKVHFWNVAEAKLVTTLDFAPLIENCGEVKYFAWSEDSQRFVTVMGNVVYFWHSPFAKK